MRNEIASGAARPRNDGAERLDRMNPEAFDRTEIFHIAGDQRGAPKASGRRDEGVHRVCLITSSELGGQMRDPRCDGHFRHQGEEMRNFLRLMRSQTRSRKQFILGQDRNACLRPTFFDLQQKSCSRRIPAEMVNQDVGINQINHAMRRRNSLSHVRRSFRSYARPEETRPSSSPAVERMMLLMVVSPSRREEAPTLNFIVSRRSSTASTSLSRSNGMLNFVMRIPLSDSIADRGD